MPEPRRVAHFVEFPEFLDVFFSNRSEPLAKSETRMSGGAFILTETEIPE
jgi:hypothetical protein